MDLYAKHRRLVIRVRDLPTPRTIRLETPNYLLRTLEPSDATASWGDWLTDPAAAQNLNARPVHMTIADIRAYVDKFDRATSHLLGIFAKETNALIGIRSIHIDWQRREFLVNVLVGESEARNKGARGETRTVMYRYFFEELGLDAARCSVLSTNAPMLDVMKRNGWLHEHISRKPEANGQGDVELHHFRLTRDAWRQ
ncbi:MAG: GNAT family protein, partial [Micropepsaceae bacterium]